MLSKDVRKNNDLRLGFLPFEKKKKKKTFLKDLFLYNNYRKLLFLKLTFASSSVWLCENNP